MNMKKILLAAMAAAVCFSAVGCGETDDDSSKKEKKASATNTSVETPEVESEEEKATETTTTTTVTTTKPTTTTTSYDYMKEVTYISDRDTQYDDINKEHIFFWSFKDGYEERIAADATITIVITNDTGAEVFNKDFKVTKSNYSTWTSPAYGERYLGSVKVKDSDITPGASNYGTFTISAVTDDGSVFDADTFKISDLPLKKASIKLPAFPASFTDLTRSYSFTQTVNVTNITYDTETHYDGSMTLTLHFGIELVSKTDKFNEGSACHVGFKLVDDEGFIAESGQIITTPLMVGEKAKEDELIFDLDPTKTYTLQLSNAS